MGNTGQKIGLVVDGGGGSASINIDINGATFLEDQTSDVNIPVVDSDDTPLGSKVGNDWEIPDNTYEVNFSGGQIVSGSAPAGEDLVFNVFL